MLMKAGDEKGKISLVDSNKVKYCSAEEANHELAVLRYEAVSLRTKEVFEKSKEKNSDA